MGKVATKPPSRPVARKPAKGSNGASVAPKRATAAPAQAVREITSFASLIPDDRNANKGSERGTGMIETSLRSYGAGRSILADRNGRVIAGNKTLEGAASVGIDRIRVVQTDGRELVVVQRTDLDLNDKAARELAIVDNRAGQVSLEWDADELERTAKEFDIDLASVGFADGEMEKLCGNVAAEVVEDELPDDVETRCKAGELWALGEHRLLCGDSTKAESWKALNAPRPSLVFTSPPYGVGGNAKLRDHYVPGAENRKSLYAAHADSPDEWPHLMQAWTALALESADCIVCNVQMLATNKRSLVAWMAEYAPHIADVCVWDKGHGAPQMQRNVLNNSFEWVFILSPHPDASRGLPLSAFHATESNVVRINAKGTNEHSDVHRATMPVELAAWGIRVAGATAKSVIDPFGGTGTTMMAAQQMGMASFLIELDPTYCDIILARWEKFTGKKAQRESQG